MQDSTAHQLGFVRKGKLLTSENVAIRCSNDADLDRLQDDTLACTILKTVGDRSAVIDASSKIFHNLSQEGRNKGLEQSCKDGDITENMLKSLVRDYGVDSNTKVGDLLVTIQEKGVADLNNIMTLRGEAASMMRELAVEATAVGELTSRLDKIMRDADSDDEDAEDEAYNSSKALKVRKKLQKIAAMNGCEFASAVENFKMESPGTINALMAIQTTTVDMPPDVHVEEILQVQQAEQDLISLRMKICDLEEEIERIRSEATYAQEALKSSKEAEESKAAVLNAEVERLKKEKTAADEETFEPLEKPASAEELTATLKARMASLEQKLDDLDKSEPQFVEPDVPDPDMSSYDSAITTANNKLEEQIRNPATATVAKKTTRHSTFFGLFTWKTESSSTSRSQQREELEQIRLGADQAQAAKASAMSRHKDEVALRSDLAQTQYEAKMESFKASRKTTKNEIKEVRELIRACKEGGDQALANHEQREASRKEAFTQRKDANIEKVVSKIEKTNTDLETWHHKCAKEQQSLAKVINHAPELEQAKKDAMKQLQDKFDVDRENLKTRQDRIQGALNNCGGSLQVMHDTLNEIRKARVGCLQADNETASLKPMMRDMLSLAAPFDEETMGDWEIWKSELKTRARRFNEQQDRGLCLLAPDRVQMAISFDKGPAQMRRDSAIGKVAGAERHGEPGAAPVKMIGMAMPTPPPVVPTQTGMDGGAAST